MFRVCVRSVFRRAHLFHTQMKMAHIFLSLLLILPLLSGLTVPNQPAAPRGVYAALLLLAQAEAEAQKRQRMK